MVKTAGLVLGIGAILEPMFKSTIGDATGRLADIGKKIKGFNEIKLNLDQYTKLANAGQTGSEEYTRLGQKLKDAKIDIIDLGKASEKLNNDVSKITNEEKQLKFSSNLNVIKKEFASFAILGTGLSKIMGSVKDSMNVTAAEGEIASLGISADGIKKISDAAVSFTNKYAGFTTPEFIKASYDIKSGISSLSDEGVAKFTSLAAVTAKATKSSIGDTTKLFAMGYGIFREQFSSDEDFGTKFSNGIAGAVQAFRTDGPDLIQGLSNLGAGATKMGVAFEQQLAVIGVSKGSFNSASDAATSYRGFIAGVGNAQETLGLKFTDSKGKMLPMIDVLKKIKGKYGDLSKVAVKDELKKAFGSEEAVKLIMALIDKTDELSAAEKQLLDDMIKGTKASEMAEAMNAGRGFDLLGQKVSNLSAIFGKIFEPAFTTLATAIGGVVLGLQHIINEYPKLTRYVVIFTTALAGVVFGYKLYKIAMAAAKVAQLALNLSMAASPFGLIAVGIAGVITAGIAMYENWDAVCEWVKNLWGGLSAYASAFWGTIKDLFSGGMYFIKNLFLKYVDGFLLPFKLALVAINKVKAAMGMDTGDGELSFTAEINKALNTDKLADSLNFARIGSGIADRFTAAGAAHNRAAIANYYTRNQSAGGANKSFAKYRPPAFDQFKSARELSAKNNPASTTNVTYSPKITIQGNADKATIDQAVKTGNDGFAQRVKSTQNSIRLSYGGA